MAAQVVSGEQRHQAGVQKKRYGRRSDRRRQRCARMLEDKSKTAELERSVKDAQVHARRPRLRKRRKRRPESQREDECGVQCLAVVIGLFD